MSRGRVIRASVAISALLGAAAWLFAWLGVDSQPLPPGSAETEAGAALFALRCGSCHRIDELSARHPGPDASAERDALQRFLLEHGGATPVEAGEIVAWLDSIVLAAPKRR